MNVLFPHFSRRHVTLGAVAMAAAVAVPAISSAALISRQLDVNIDSNPGGASSSPTSATYPIDFNNDGATDFIIAHNTTPAAPDTNGKVNLNGQLKLNKGQTAAFLAIVKDTDGVPVDPSVNQVGVNTIQNFAERLVAGDRVDATRTFLDLTSASYDNRLQGNDTNGARNGTFSGAGNERPSQFPLPDGVVQYVGFAFGNAANPNYGALEFTAVGADDGLQSGTFQSPANAVLSRVIYESTPGVGITVPEPGSLSAAGLGLLGVLARRRRR